MLDCLFLDYEVKQMIKENQPEIKLLVIDVDGTLTNGEIIYNSKGEEIKNFNVKDGMAISLIIKKLGFKVALITGRESEIVEKRKEDLGIQYLYQNIKDKKSVVEKILQKENLTWENVAAIGDDLNDYKMLEKSEYSFCPGDAVQDIKDISGYECKSNGGQGCVREMIEEVLQDNMQPTLKDLWFME